MKDHNNDDGDRGYEDGMSLKKTLGDESPAFEEGYIKGLTKRLEKILSRKSSNKNNHAGDRYFG